MLLNSWATLLASSRRHGRSLTVKMLQPIQIPTGQVLLLNSRSGPEHDAPHYHYAAKYGIRAYSAIDELLAAPSRGNWDDQFDTGSGGVAYPCQGRLCACGTAEACWAGDCCWRTSPAICAARPTSDGSVCWPQPPTATGAIF